MDQHEGLHRAGAGNTGLSPDFGKPKPPAAPLADEAELETANPGEPAPVTIDDVVSLHAILADTTAGDVTRATAAVAATADPPATLGELPAGVTATDSGPFPPVKETAPVSDAIGAIAPGSVVEATDLPVPMTATEVLANTAAAEARAHEAAKVPADVTAVKDPLVDEINECRRFVKESASWAKAIKKTYMASTALGAQRPDEDQGEVIANLTLAYRHLEDASMRLGKAIQARDGGISVYDRSTTVGA